MARPGAAYVVYSTHYIQVKFSISIENQVQGVTMPVPTERKLYQMPAAITASNSCAVNVMIRNWPAKFENILLIQITMVKLYTRTIFNHMPLRGLPTMWNYVHDYAFYYNDCTLFKIVIYF